MIKIEQLREKLFFKTSSIVFIVCLLIFGSFAYFRISADIFAHARMTFNIVNHKSLPPANFLYYLIIYIFAFFSTNIKAIYLASIFILSSSVTAKYIITKHFLIENNNKTWISDLDYSLFSIILILVFSIPLTILFEGSYYLGNIPPNIWHNSTTIFLMPFALLLFWKAYDQIKNSENNNVVALSLLVVLNLLIKPSYLFVFVIVYPCFLVKRNNFVLSKQLITQLIPAFIGYLGIAIQYIIIYVFGIGVLDEGSSGTTISLFTVWSAYSPNIGHFEKLAKAVWS